MLAALLLGDHPTLPQAELAALSGRPVPGGRVVLLPDQTSGLDRAAGVLQHGRLVAAATDDPPGHQDLIHAASHSDGNGTIAVVPVRFGQEKPADAMTLVRAVGAAFVQAGHAVDLGRPERTFGVWRGEQRAWLVEHSDRPRIDYEGRRVERRSHFQPVSLHPRRAAQLVNLAAPTGGRILDPFCGTGGIALEAALLGHEVVASDIDPIMVQGTLQTLTDVPPAPLDVTAFVADVGELPDRIEPVDAIVTDLPYGRASTTKGEGIEALYRRAFTAFATLVPEGGRVVAGCADPLAVQAALGDAFVAVGRHDEFVHRSLTRHFVVVKRTSGVAPA